MRKVSVEVCCGLHCSLKGGQELLDLIESNPLFQGDQFDFIPVNCLQCCDDGALSPVVSINGENYMKITPERLVSTLRTFIN
ncbi:MAG: NAD(P)H-dependent oxidoreductase subunit E [Candidatus Lokiarchaeota archaeon]|nr:NAD(P)H-dependent oxidoreductase subunit E [Candidatus Lokiarchaeota archaeon]